MICELTKKTNHMIKKGISENDVKIYELNISKQMTHYENIKMWHNLILTINSLIFGAVALIVGLGSDSNKEFEILNFFNLYQSLLLPVSILGIVFCVAWLITHIDSVKWQNAMNEIIKNCEDSILEFPKETGMWNMITSNTKNSNDQFRLKIIFDTVYIQSLIPMSFLCCWIYMFLVIILTN